MPQSWSSGTMAAAALPTARLRIAAQIRHSNAASCSRATWLRTSLVHLPSLMNELSSGATHALWHQMIAHCHENGGDIAQAGIPFFGQGFLQPLPGHANLPGNGTDAFDSRNHPQL